MSHRVGLHRFARLTAACTLLLIVAGGLVTSTGSGLAVPDWPLSYGMLMPPMVGGVRFEHGHRMAAATVAVLTLVLAVWLALREPRRWVRALGFTALGTILLQALLGGMTVLFLLPTWISVSHACLAQTFFCLTVVIALVTSPRWRARSRPGPADHRMTRPLDTLGKLSLAFFSAVYLQLILGALMRHMDAGLAIPDFPLAFGRLVPPHWSREIAVAFAHRAGALLVAAIGTALIVTLFRLSRERAGAAAAASLLAVLIPGQIALGAFTVLSGRTVAIATAHVATGALILATGLVIAIRFCRPALEGWWDALASRARPRGTVDGGAESGARDALAGP